MIGFKEFDDYFNYTVKNMLNGKIVDEKRIDDEAIRERLIKRGLHNLRTITKKYSKKQVDWFKNRFLSNMNRRPTPPIFSFDANDLSKWNDAVKQPAIEIVDHILFGQRSFGELPEHLEQYKASELKKAQNEKQLRHCKYCDKQIVDDIVWNDHLNSKSHKHNYDQWLEREQMNRVDLKSMVKLSLALIISILIGYHFTK